MNLFNDVRRLYGQSTVKKIRDLENVNKKISRYTNYLTFTHRCKDLNLTPVSLKLKCPIRTNNAKKIIEKAEKELVRERIRVISNKLISLKTKREVADKDLETLNPEVKAQVDFHVNNARDRKVRNARHVKSTNYSG